MIKLTLKGARANKGLKTKDAAKKLGVSESTLYKWESGQNKPNSKYLPKIEEVYGIELANLIF